MPNLLNFAIKTHNAARKFLWPYQKATSVSRELQEIEAHASRFPTDIADHLSTIFSESIAMQPGLIVELGVRGGESRFVFERVAKISDSFLVSADIDDCSASCGKSPKWFFLKGDDVDFGRNFRNWRQQQGIAGNIDVLFIDTSHLYEHTVEEIREWFPHLNPRCKVIFHDTNLRSFGRRIDGTIMRAWDNERGVIRAIEDYLGTKINERVNFVTTINEWVVRHWAYCNGLTILERVPCAALKKQ